MSRAGDARLRNVHRVHAGALFDVFHGALGDREVAVKRPAGQPRWSAGVGSSWTHSNRTNVFHTRQIGWAEGEPAPDLPCLEALLRAEHAVIGRVTADWNHPGAELARWSGEGRIAPGDADPGAGALCLVMPWCSGDSFASLPRAEQRRWFPAMLRSLWRALTACPHGDLSPANLMLEPAHGYFRILDPGVRITGPSHPGGLNFDSHLFTTNAAHYPFVVPEHGPEQPRVRAPGGGLAAITEGHGRPLPEVAYRVMTGEPSSTPAPSVADVIACGAIYFGVLTGSPMISVLGIDEPLWSGYWSSRGNLPDPHPPILDAIAGGAIARALRAAGATAAETALCEGLVKLDLDRATLLGWIAEVLRPPG